MMRRLSEQELLRESPRRLGEHTSTHEPERSAVLLTHVLRVLSAELSAEQLSLLRPELVYAIARGLRGDP